MSTIEEILSAAVSTAKKANAQDAVFQDKSDLSAGKSEKVSSPPHPSKPPLKAKDFYWDQMVTVLASAILGLTVLDIAVEFFRGFGVQCFTPATINADSSPPGDFTRDQAAYINSYCYQSLPPTEYYPVFIVVHGLAIVAPHYLWLALFGGYFDFFFDLTKDLNRLRNIKTGAYDARDFEIVKKLEKEYTNRLAYYSYILKLVAQLLIAIFSLLFAAFFFSDFSPNFNCPNGGISENSTSSWPLSVTVTCVYTSLRFLSVIHIVDCILTGLSVLVVVFGLLWCLLGHTSELGHRHVAHFVVGSCFLPEHYVPAHSFAFTPRIKSDLDFLVMRLFRTDSGHGQVFKEIQVQREVDMKTRQEYELLQLFRTVETGGELRTQDIYKIFKDAGFKGLPRLDVYRRFSPLFGIVKRELCPEPLRDPEVQRIAEEIAADGGETVTALAVQLGVQGDDSEEQNLIEKTRVILNQWRQRRSGDSGMSGRVSDAVQLQELGSENMPDNSLPQPSSNQDRNADGMHVPDRKELANLLQSMQSSAMKLTAFAVRYGTYLEPEAAVEAFQNRIHGFLRITPQSKFAMSVSFGSSGCAHILAWAFKEVVSVNFDPYLQDEDSVVKVDTFFTNVITMRFPTDIFTQKTDNVVQVENALIPIIYGPGDVGRRNMQDNAPRTRVDFIVIGPIDNPAKNVTVTLMMDKLHTDQAIRNKAVLLAVRPLTIGSKDVSSRFTQYVPPPSLFESISKTNDMGDEYEKLRLEIAQEVRRKTFRVAEAPHGHKVYLVPTKCGDIACLLEFSVYIYGKPEVASRGMWEQATHSNDSNQRMQGGRIGGRKDAVAVPVAGVLQLVQSSREVEGRRGEFHPTSTSTVPGLRRRTTTQSTEVTPTSARRSTGTVQVGASGTQPGAHGSTVEEESARMNQPTTLSGADAAVNGERGQYETVSHNSFTSEDERCWNRAHGGVPASGEDRPPVQTKSESSFSDTDAADRGQAHTIAANGNKRQWEGELI